MNNIISEDVIIQNGFNLHLVPTKKYKTINIVAKLKAPLKRETITKRALLPYILRKGTTNYPTEKEFQEKLDSLYGAVFSIDGAKKGNNHIISFRLEVANQKYIANESAILNEAIDLLKEVIFAPNREGQAFNKRIVHREKETLKQKMDAVIDDKMAYANMRLVDEMCEGELYQIHVNGYEEDLDSITAENVYSYYETVLKEDALDIYVLGDFNAGEIKEKFTSSIEKNNEIKTTEDEKEPQKRAKELKVVTEKQDVQQAKLHIGYRTNCTFNCEDYFALQVFNGIFGGFPSSKLFINVREKNSLAYYAASRIESHKGLLFVVSGIAPEDYEKAREIIELQMTAMKNGDFTEDDISETKEQIVNQLLETLDHPQGIIELLYQQVLGNIELPPNELIDGIKQVTKEDIIQLASKIEEDTVYLLTTKGESNE